MLVEVCCSSTWTLLHCVGGYFVPPLECRGAGKLFHLGIRLQTAAASCAHVSCSGGWEPVAWVQLHLRRHRDF